MMNNELAEQCIYTIVHQDDLVTAYNRGLPATFEESKVWTTGHSLWIRAEAENKLMPILLGDATDCSKLIYWGILTQIEVGRQSTRYTVERLRQVHGAHAPQELVLLSTGENIAADFIRPYAICKTPDFIRANYTTTDYAKVLREMARSPHHQRMLLAHYYSKNHNITATQMAKALGYPSYKAANLHYGKLGHLVGAQLGWKPLPEQTVFVLVTFDKPDREWHWIMRPEVTEALEQIGWVKDEQAAIPEEVDITAPLYEGAVKKIAVNTYERNSVARERCILHYGCHCSVCGLSLAEKYGEPAQGLIHVHHLRQLADVNAKYQIDPIKDLRPVCPTCHAVIHSRPVPFSIEEVTAMIEKTQKKPSQTSRVTARSRSG